MLTDDQDNNCLSYKFPYCLWLWCAKMGMALEKRARHWKRGHGTGKKGHGSDCARPKCSPDILSGQHSLCSDILKYFRTNDKSIISFKVYL